MKMMVCPKVSLLGIGIALIFSGCAAGAISKREDAGSIDRNAYPASQRIVFTSTQHGNWEIYMISTDSGRVLRLTESLLEEEGLAPSRDGRRLAFVSRRDGDYEIYVMAIDGTEQRRLTFSSGIDEGPIWLNDDSRILFESARDRNWEIYVMNPDGSDQVNLTQTQADEADPVVSPDGSHVAFKSMRDGHWRLYTMQIDGSNPVALADSEYLEGAHDDPSWAPNSQQIAFISSREGNSEIYRVELPPAGAVEKSGDPMIHNLTRHPARDEGPVWSPDGSRIAFVSDREGERKVFIMKADGADPVPVGPVPIEEAAPRWSPDGEWIAYIAKEPRGPFIQLVHVTEGWTRRLALPEGRIAELQWIPSENRRLTFTDKETNHEKDI